jgi:tRNA uridine 5-carbamoylmethylation protein Kti12
MAILNFMVGFPCTGKSTYIQKNLMSQSHQTHQQSVVISSDAYIEEKAKELGIGYSEAFPLYIKEAVNYIKSQVNFAIENSHSVIWDQTNLTKNIRVDRLGKFPGKIYKKVGYVFQPAIPEILYARMKNLRPDKIIPIEVLDSMYAKYEVPSIDEGFDEIIHISSDFD